MSGVYTIFLSYLLLVGAASFVRKSLRSSFVTLFPVSVRQVTESPVPFFLLQRQLDQFLKNMERVFSPSSVQDQIQAEHVIMHYSVHQ